MAVRVRIVARPMYIRSWDDLSAEIPRFSQFSTCVAKCLKLVSNFPNFFFSSKELGARVVSRKTEKTGSWDLIYFFNLCTSLLVLMNSYQIKLRDVMSKTCKSQ